MMWCNVKGKKVPRGVEVRGLGRGSHTCLSPRRQEFVSTLKYSFNSHFLNFSFVPKLNQNKVDHVLPVMTTGGKPLQGRLLALVGNTPRATLEEGHMSEFIYAG